MQASSFWNTKLMWRLLLCTSLACFTLSFCRNLEMIEKGEESGNFQFEPGMLTFNSNRRMRFKHQWELLLCCVLGAMTGAMPFPCILCLLCLPACHACHACHAWLAGWLAGCLPACHGCVNASCKGSPWQFWESQSLDSGLIVRMH